MELNICKIWDHFKSNATLMKYIFDYSNGNLSEKEFIYITYDQPSFLLPIFVGNIDFAN